MGRMSDEWYREEAKRRYEKPRKVATEPAAEVRGYADVDKSENGPPKPGVYAEPTPTVSKGTSPGAWVMLWVWVPDPPPEENERGQEEQPGGGGHADGG